jgi:hypothetical protein
MDFDRCSGLISNIRKRHWNSFTTSILGPNLAFSSSGQYLYVADAMTILQYDVWAEDVFSTEVVVAEYDGFISYSPNGAVERRSYFSRFQLGPDGKIYVPSSGVNFYLGVIHHPDRKGLACEVEQHSVRLPTYVYGTTPTFPTLRLGPVDGSSCDTLGVDNNPVSRFRYEQDSLDYLSIDFVDLAYYEPTSWLWEFGDGETSAERFPSHRYTQDASYRVCLTISNANSVDVYCDTLFLGVSSLDQAPQRHITIFPNPIEDVTRVAFHDYLPHEPKIKIYNQTGNLVKISSLNSLEPTIDFSDIIPGLYLYEIYDNDKLLQQGRIVKI